MIVISLSIIIYVCLFIFQVHLLCLLAHAMINNELCNNQLIQSLMVSMVPKSLALVDYTILGKDMLSRLLKWYLRNSEMYFILCLKPR